MEKSQPLEPLEPAGDLTGEQEVMASNFTGGSPSSEKCSVGIFSLPSSTTYQQSPWEPHFIELTATNSSSDGSFQNFLDVNGDGLTDYIYTFRASGGGSSTKLGCVMLNNGEGWEPVYRCRMHKPNNIDPWEFYGDCADT